MYHFRMRWAMQKAKQQQQEKMRDSDDAFGLWRAHLFAQTYTVQKKITFNHNRIRDFLLLLLLVVVLVSVPPFFTLCVCMCFFSLFY